LKRYVYIEDEDMNSLLFVFTLVMSSVVAHESVAVELERAPVAQMDEYWPLTLDAVNACDLSYMNDTWSEDMIRDGMRSIIRVGQLPGVREKEINVWKYLSNYSPPADRGFMFSYGDDRIVTLVGDHMETGHSGCSMGWTMRNIEFIAKNGVPAHREMIIENRRRREEEGRSR
jgi:hypothetical protein